MTPHVVIWRGLRTELTAFPLECSVADQEAVIVSENLVTSASLFANLAA